MRATNSRTYGGLLAERTPTAPDADTTTVAVLPRPRHAHHLLADLRTADGKAVERLHAHDAREPRRPRPSARLLGARFEPANAERVRTVRAQLRRWQRWAAKRDRLVVGLRSRS